MLLLRANSRWCCSCSFFDVITAAVVFVVPVFVFVVVADLVGVLARVRLFVFLLIFFLNSACSCCDTCCRCCRCCVLLNVVDVVDVAGVVIVAVVLSMPLSLFT